MATTVQFILQIVAMCALGVLIYIVSRGVPRVSETKDTMPEFHMFDRVISRVPLQKFDAFVENTIRKFLRKVKISVMKVDHAISARLQNGDSVSSSATRTESLKENEGEHTINKL